MRDVYMSSKVHVNKPLSSKLIHIFYLFLGFLCRSSYNNHRE